MKRCRDIRAYFLWILIVTVALILGGCGGGIALRTDRETAPADLSGSFRVILFGTEEDQGLHKVAFLDLEGDEYELEPYAPDFDFRVLKSVPGDKAFEIAREFVSAHHAFHQLAAKKILSETGKVIGYEIRPLYFPLEYGAADVLNISYFLQGGKKVRVYISLDRSIELFLNSNHGAE